LKLKALATFNRLQADFLIGFLPARAMRYLAGLRQLIRDSDNYNNEYLNS
jgi:hypothetical protein